MRHQRLLVGCILFVVLGSLVAAGVQNSWGRVKVIGKAPGLTGLELGMQESYSENLASYAGPESYAGGGNIAGVATTGVHAGKLLSSEIITSVCRRRPDVRKATPLESSMARFNGARRSQRT